jgi:hypothetical protein
VTHPTAKIPLKSGRPSEVGNAAMGDVIVIGGLLNDQLATRIDHRKQARDEASMVLDPVNGCIGKNKSAG